MQALFAVVALSLGAPALAQSPVQSPVQSPELVLTGANTEVPFQWSEARFGDRVEPHAALLLPVRVEGSPKTLYMQFDLGAPDTVLMKGKLESLSERLPGQTVGADGRVAHFAFAMGDVRADARQVRIVDDGSNGGIRWDEPEHVDVIGTVGADLLRGRTLVIDYPRSRIFVGDEAPEGLVAEGQMRPFIFTPRGVVLTGLTIDGEAKAIMLDTGSSAFSLLTSQDDWMAKTNGGVGATSFGVNSWGRTLTAHVAPTRSVAAFGETVIPLGEVAWIEGVDEAQANAMRSSGLGGMTGNKLFVDRVLVLDAVNSTFAVLDPQP
ncbi:hypothetical protein [Brevundimonas sp. GCM10030266]|uniref:hypothetical protein n=1 Tax=Brevundimonas sp. GCM10030266 TaxID=3273386 RepID=UPI00361381FA